MQQQRGTAAGIAGIVRELGALVLPSPCAVCRTPCGPLCPACAAAIDDRAHVREVGGLMVHSAWRYDERSAPPILALKGEGRTELAAPLGRALRPVLCAAADGAGPVMAVPIPVTRRAFRTRGYRVVELLLRHARVDFVRALRSGRTVRDQRALGRAERERNMAGAFRAARGAEHRLTRAVLVDDVVTTGATLRAAAAELERVGIIVVGAATLAWTPQGKSLAPDP